MAWPEVESAVHTMPASAITKNMPVVPETPKRSSTMEEMMMVSMVIPDTGFRAVVAIALAATEVKKNENSSASATPAITTAGELLRLPRKMPMASALTTTPSRMVTIGRSRSVRSPEASLPTLKAFNATPKESATMRSDFTMPKMPAVAIAPTPTNRT